MMKRVFLLLFISILAAQATGQTRELSYFIEKGLENSPLLKEFNSQEQRSKLDSLLLNAESGLQISGVSTNFYAPTAKGWGYDQAITDGGNISAQVMISKELTSLKKRQCQYLAINLQRLSAANSRKKAEQELKKTITNQYIIAFGDWRQYQYNKELLTLLNQEATMLANMADAGIYKQTDYLSFNVNLKQQEILSRNLSNQYNTDFFTLCWLCGINDTSLYVLSDPQLKPASLPVFSSTVFYNQFRLDSLKLRNKLQQTAFIYQPKISLFADAGYLSSLAAPPGKNLGASAGFSVSIPLYDGGQLKLRQKQLAFDEFDQLNQFRFYQSQFQQQTANIRRQLQENSDLASQLSEQITLSRSLMEANHKLLESGDLQLADYFLAVRSYLDALNLLTQNKMEKYQLINELNYWNRSN